MTTVASIVAERDHLRWLVEQMTTLPDPLANGFPFLTTSQRRLLARLLQKEGQTVTYISLEAALHGTKPADNWPYPDVVKVQICKIRKALRERGIPLVITNHYAVGYRAHWSKPPSNLASENMR